MIPIQKYIEQIKKNAMDDIKVTSIPLLKENNCPLEINNFKKIFMPVFKKLDIYNRDFEFTIESKNFYYTLLYYFYKKDNFYKSPCLISSENEPSLLKGLLIVGNSGVGKSSVLKTFEFIFRELCVFNPEYSFKLITANEAVTQYEILENSLAKEYFYNSMSKGFKCFDDVKSEDEASNFGKKDVLKEIISKRYDNHKRTIATCNFDENFPNDYKKAIDEFGTKYNGRIYDRVYDLFNIVIVGGKSFRK